VCAPAMTQDSSPRSPLGAQGNFARAGRGAFVGRAAEMKALDEVLTAVENGEARIVTIVGPAGAGKSRLVQELVQRRRGAASFPRLYRGSARDTGAPFGVFGRLLRARFGLVEGMDKEAAREQVRAQVATVLDDGKVGDVVYFLCQLLGVPGEESPLTRALGDDPQEAAILRRAVVKAFLEADAAASPLCLVFEDVHLAHDDSVTLLRALLEYLSGRILVLCTARTELYARHEEWGRAGEARHRVIELGPLGAADADALLRDMLAPCEGGPPVELVERARAFAGGNPSLLEQMVRIYLDKGVLADVAAVGETPRWRVDLDRLAAAALPLTVGDAVTARVAALEPAALAVLEQAAAMGPVFWTGAFVPLARMGRDAPDLWGQAAGDDATAIQATLAGLVERDYVRRLPDASFPGSEEYAFANNLELEAVGKRTRPSVLRRYHQILADWMEQKEATNAREEYASMLAEHREKAGDPIRAGVAYLDAGDVARERYASSRACELYQRGLDLLGESFALRRIDALHHYGDVLQLSGRIDDALAAFREMLGLAYRLDLKNKGGAAHNRIGRLYRGTGALEDAGKHLHAGLSLFREVDDERGVASSIDDIGKLHWLKGEYEQALVALRDGLARRRKLADRRSIALSLNNIGLAQQDSGHFKDAVESFTQALQIRRAIGDLVGVVTTLNNLGTIAQDQSDFPRALALFDEALGVARQIGDRNRTSLVLTNIGETHYRMGSPDQAILVLKQAEELFDELGDKLGLAEALRGLGKAYMLDGNLPKAREAISRAVDLFAAVRSKVHLGVALRTLGEITAAGGWGSAHTKSAREYFARAAAIFEQTGNDVELARTFKVFSRFLLDGAAKTDEGARREAIGMNTRAEAIFTRLRITAGPMAVTPTRPSGP
jgi:tetratricopeptide (TPR) repeat protein